MTHIGRKGHEPLDLGTLATNVQTAKSLYDEACKAVSLAETQKRTALDRVNDAQREFDNACAALRKDPPLHSEWSKLEAKRV